MIRRVKNSIPASVNNILMWLKTRGIVFFNAPVFENGIIIKNEKGNEIELTYDRLQALIDLIDRKDTKINLTKEKK